LSPEYIWASFGWLAASQPATLFSHTNSAPATRYQPVSSIFLSQQISTSHQPVSNIFLSQRYHRLAIKICLGIGSFAHSLFPVANRGAQLARVVITRGYILLSLKISVTSKLLKRIYVPARRSNSPA
jgi:hypothetical protein